MEPNLENGREYHLAQLEIMDREIGRLRVHLEETGQAEKTIFVYLTDNRSGSCGTSSPDRRLLSTGPRADHLISSLCLPDGR